MNKKVVIVSAVRTPIGSFLGSLSGVPATELGAIAIKGALEKINLDPKLVDEVLMGNVLQANLGQAPAKQAALKAGISHHVPCTTINKVCASGMKAVTQGVQAIQCGDANILVVGGMENMSRSPHYIQTRDTKKFGDLNLIDGLLKDGLTNAYDQKHMGLFADLCASNQNISRKQQDDFAENSYVKAEKTWKENGFAREIIPVHFTSKKGTQTIIDQDEEYKKVDFKRMRTLKAAFSKTGTVTAANASTLNDGAAALILMSLKKAQELNLTPLATIVSYADASQEPSLYTTSPAKAIPILQLKTSITLN